MVRALALRTMGCIRIERILDYVIEPLRRGIRDSSPYVRKTSALCIAKIFDLNPEVSEDCGFLNILQELLMTDSNPMVVSNVVAALADIQALVPDLEALQMNDELFVRLTQILGDCTEWGQVFIMDTLAEYEGNSEGDIEKMIETVIPKLQHANQAVVMSSINLLVRQGLQSRVLDENHQLRTVILRKLSSPLISILSPPNVPEIQYAALRNVNLLVQAYPKLFGSEIGVFFCSYSDPQYVKLEKLEIIGKIVDDSSIDRILPELCEYAKDVDSEIVKKAIKVLSRCALNVPRWAGRIMEIFRELLETGLPIVLQQVTVNLVPLLRSNQKQDFFRLVDSFYFADLDSTASALYGDISSQSAFIWILGEFCQPDYFDSERCEQLVNFYTSVALSDSFQLEGVQFQSQIVLCALKMFLNNGGDVFGAELLKRIVRKGREEAESVDLRDRCAIYERILNHEVLDGGKTTTLVSSPVGSMDDWGNVSDVVNDGNTEQSVSLKEIILSDDSSDSLDLEDSEFQAQEDKLIKILLSQLTKLSSVYHQLPSDFTSARVIMRDNPSGGLSPLEQSVNKLSLSEGQDEYVQLPVAWTKLLRNNRPAVANLLDFTYVPEVQKNTTMEEAIAVVSPKKDKYANLLDLLD